MNKCKDCNKNISIKAERCASCSTKRKHKIGILNILRNVIWKLISIEITGKIYIQKKY